MSDDTPDRLKAFRAGYQAPGTRVVPWLVAQSALLCLGIALVAVVLLRGGAEPAAAAPGRSPSGLSPDDQRRYAAYLAEKNLPGEAIAAYEAYLDAAPVAPEERARVNLGIAKLAMDQGKHETALARLYQAELLAPGSDVAPEVSKRIVQCLDVLGRASDLRRELKARTTPARTAADVQPGEKVLAEFSGQVITDRDLDRELDKAPASVRSSLDTPEKREGLLRELVAERLLLDKALRQGLDEDPEVREELAAQRDALVVRRLIEQEVRSKVSVTPEDVERFYRAELPRFSTPATATVRVGSADTQEAAAALQDLPGDAVTVREGGTVPGMPPSPDFVRAICGAEPGSRVGPRQIGERWYVAQVEARAPGQPRPFEEVRDEAERLLRMQKEQEQMQALLNETLQAENVQFHLDNLNAAPEAGS